MSEDNKNPPEIVDTRPPVSPDAAKRIEGVLEGYRAKVKRRSDVTNAATPELFRMRLGENVDPTATKPSSPFSRV